MSAMQMVDLGALHAELGAEIEDAVLRVVRSGRYVGGPEVAAFERAFADYLGVRHAIGMANGTDAVQLSLIATGIGSGDEVLLPANTFIATAEAVVAAGATPRFVDVAPDTGLIDLASAQERVSPRARAIIAVHLYGRMADMEAVSAFAQRHGLVVIEDSAQAHGAQRAGRCAGTVGAVGSFSFYPGKNLGALGDAGAAVTDDDGIADRLRLLRDHGRRGRDEHEVIGFNSRLDPLQAAVLAVKLPHLDRWTVARRAVAERYRDALGPLLDWPGPDPADAAGEVHHLFPILVEDRDAVEAALKDARIPVGVHYRRAITMTRAFASSPDACPVAEDRARRQLSLPIHPHLDAADVARVVAAVTSATAVAV